MIRLIAGIDRQRGIAKHGDQPWNIPSDLSYFREQTLQHGASALVGQRTFELIFGGKPLVGRRTLVASRHMADQPDVTMIRDLDQFWKEWQEDLWVVGGAGIYAAALPYASELYLTLIDADFGCDQFFPDYEQHFVMQDTGDTREENGFTYRYTRWTARPN